MKCFNLTLIVFIAILFLLLNSYGLIQIFKFLGCKQHRNLKNKSEQDTLRKSLKGSIHKYHSIYITKKIQKERFTSTHSTPTQTDLISLMEKEHSHHPHYGYRHRTSTNMVTEDIKTTTSLSDSLQHTNPRIHITTNKIHIPDISTSTIPHIEIHHPEIDRHHGWHRGHHRVSSSTSTTTTVEAQGAITIVTALLDIGRDKWNKYRRPIEKYHEYMENLLSLRNNMVIFTDRSSYDFIHNYRKTLSLMHQTKIHLMSLNDLPLYRYIEYAQSIIENEHRNHTLWRSIWDPTMRDHPEAMSAEYDVLVNSKTYFLHNATLEDPFSSEFFVWIDAGYGHGNQSIFPYNNLWEPNFPNGLISLIKLTPEHDKIFGYNLDNLYRRNWSVLSGGFVAGDKRSIGQLHTRVHRKFIELIHRNKVDDDQTVMVLVVNSIPNLFSIRQGDWFDAFRLFSTDQIQFGK